MKITTMALVLGASLFFACSDDSSGSGGSSAGGSSGTPAGATCVKRCEAVQTECGADPTACGQICAAVTEAELACVESARCDKGKSAACFESGSGGTGGSTGGGGKGGSTSTGGSGGSSSSSCSLFKCTKTAECPLSPCMSNDTAQAYCYGQAASEKECDGIGSPKNAFVAGTSRILCVPAGCPDPGTYLP